MTIASQAPQGLLAFYFSPFTAAFSVAPGLNAATFRRGNFQFFAGLGIAAGSLAALAHFKRAKTGPCYRFPFL